MSGGASGGKKNIVSGKVMPGGLVIQDAGHVEVVQRGATPDEIAAGQKALEKKQLKDAVIRRQAALRELIAAPPLPGNPYRVLQPLEWSEGARLAGRQGAIRDLLARIGASPTTFLAGNDGVGKTSLLQAGIVPALLEAGHLPLLVTVSSAPLAESILRLLDFPAGRGLADALAQAADCLPRGRRVVVLVDGFEVFFTHSTAEERAAFFLDWQTAHNNHPGVRWLFSISLGVAFQLGYFETELYPLANTVILPPLGREAAREAVEMPARAAGITIDPPLVDEVLDGLGEAVDPAQLQLVCAVLAGGTGPLVTHWTVEAYRHLGGVDGIVRDYLDQTLKHWPPEQRLPAWQVLAALAGAAEPGLGVDQVAERAAGFGLKGAPVLPILERQRGEHLAGFDDGCYRLSSPRLKMRIEQWIGEQAALVKAGQEARRQVRQMRNSALRGLLAGALGFVLFDQLIYAGQAPDVVYLAFEIMLCAGIGAVAGFLLILTIDLVKAAYDKTLHWLAIVLGGLSGAAALAVLMVMYMVINTNGDATLRVMPFAVAAGGAWGLAAGIGIAWGMDTRRPFWLALALPSVAGALVLMLAEMGFTLLGGPLWKVALGGAVLPLALALAARIGRPAGGE
jgi:hypothetical protein